MIRKTDVTCGFIGETKTGKITQLTFIGDSGDALMHILKLRIKGK